MIMEPGTNQVKEAYQPILAELMIDIADIIDKYVKQDGNIKILVQGLTLLTMCGCV